MTAPSHVDPPRPAAADLDWGPVLAFLPRLAASDADLGAWRQPEPREDGTLVLGYAELSRLVGAFVQTLYDKEVVAPFDWPTWFDQRGRQLQQDETELAAASLEECRMLLAAHVRADRFSEGHLLSVLEDGHVQQTLRRVAEILDGDEDQGRA